MSRDVARVVLLIGVVCLLALQSAALAPPVVKIVRAPAVIYDDDEVVLFVQVEPRPDNRLLVVGAWDGDSSIRTSLEQLDGDTSPRSRWIRWRRLTAGSLELRAYVFGQGRAQLGMDRRPLEVIARF